MTKWLIAFAAILASSVFSALYVYITYIILSLIFNITYFQTFLLYVIKILMFDIKISKTLNLKQIIKSKSNEKT